MAMPLPLVAGVDTSVTMAVDRETLPGGGRRRGLEEGEEINEERNDGMREERTEGLCTFGDSAQHPRQDEHCEVGGENPEEIGEGDSLAGRQGLNEEKVEEEVEEEEEEKD